MHPKGIGGRTAGKNTTPCYNQIVYFATQITTSEKPMCPWKLVLLYEFIFVFLLLLGEDEEGHILPVRRQQFSSSLFSNSTPFIMNTILPIEPISAA